jgi:Animal haem peroxidase
MSSSSGNAGKDARHTTFRAEIDSAFSKVGSLVKASMGPVHAKYPYLPSNDPPAPKGDLLADINSLGFEDVGTLLQSFYDQTKGVEDDNTLLLERLVKVLSSLPADSKEGKSLTDGFINELWSALPHPPVTSLGTKYKYRDADGGNNSISNPDLGRANTPYARSARPQIIQNIALPDPGEIFDSLMARGNKFEPHPNKISSMLFYLASIIIHDLFRTVSLVMRGFSMCVY